MDNSGENASGPAGQPPTDAVSLPPDHVSLRVTYLVTGNPRPPHSLGVLPLTTTISMLKEKIQAELPEHPSPIEQRLIYQGRPLLQNDATLREVLRIEPGNSPGPLPYTLHIVVQIRSHTAATNDASNPAPSANPLPPPASNPDPSRTNHIGAVENTATRLQESLARLQHQIEANRADLLAVQHRIGMHHTHMGVPVNGAVHLPTIHAAGNGPALPMPVPMNFQNVRPYPPPVPAAWQTGHLGWHTRSPNNPNYNNHTPWTQQAPNLSGNPSNPSHPNPQMPQPSVQEYRGPNGEHVTVMTSQMTLPMTLSRPASAPGQPVSRGPAAAPQPSQTAHHPHALHHALSNPTATRSQPPPLPFSGFPTHLPMPFSQNRQFQPQPSTSNPTAWLLSSPAGPQGFLFAPGHGYFSTTQSSVQSQSTAPQVAPTETSGPAPVAEPTQQQPQAQVDGADNGNADGALVRGNQGPAQPPLVQVQQNPEDNDLFGFLIQRGWLFLRLYLFMFVFSEPGTWKRWAMIIIAVIVCLQPRDGPFVRAMQAARRHLDNLIGPPAPQRQPDPAARGQPRPAENAINQATHRPVNVRGAVQMTPEEAAARLLRENQERNRGFWRDIFYRIEQSIALFLASLIPGVGERHVMAREEARRETQRQEEERRRAAEEAAAQQRATDEGSNQVQENADQVAAGVGSEVKVDRPDEPSTSTSVQVRDTNGEAGELRNRTT